MAGHGGARPNSGRKPGSVVDMAGRIAARQHAEKAMKRLVNLMENSESDAVRMGAAIDILNRAYGKPHQAVEVTGADGGPIEHTVIEDAERFTRTIVGLIVRAREIESAGEPVDGNEGVSDLPLALLGETEPTSS